MDIAFDIVHIALLGNMFVSMQLIRLGVFLP